MSLSPTCIPSIGITATVLVADRTTDVYISYERIDGSLKAPTKILSRVEYVKQTAKEGARLSIG